MYYYREAPRWKKNFKPHRGGCGDAGLYVRRWNIETGFEKLKSHGFHMEDSRLRGEGKMEVLLAALAIAMAWSYSCGKWSVEHVAPNKLKKHGRRAHSVFARGLMLIGDVLHGSRRCGRGQ